MSGQWEVVGKKKEKPSKLPVSQKPPKENKKKEVPTVNLNEVLGKNQINNLFSNTKQGKEKVFDKKAQESGTKKTTKKPEAKVQETPKPKVPKSIESALNLINVEEFKNVFEKSKMQFPDAPIVWLKELSQFLNQKVSIEVYDPVFTNKALDYPFNTVPPGMKSVIEKACKDANESNVQIFFDISLTSMATDMAKNFSALGHKLFLQYIASTQPSLVVASLQKHTVLRNSYQNRPNIGLSILWAVGQVGFKDFRAGLTVFQELMLPVIEMKNYSRYIVKYLLDIINNSAIEQKLSKEEYLLILEVAFSNYKNFPNDLKKDLMSVVPSLNNLLFGKKNNKEKLGSFVEFFLKNICNNSNKSYQDCLCSVLTECFIRDQASLETVREGYNRNVAASAILLKHLNNKWKIISNKIDKNALKNMLSEFESSNNELLSKKRKAEGLQDAVAAVKALSDKMASNGKSGSPFKLFFFLFTLSLAGLVYYDIKKEGSWQNSRTLKALKDSGACDYTHRALDTTKQGLLWVDGHIEETFPGYHQTLCDFSEPYIELAKNLGLVVYNVGCNIKEAILVKYPVVIQSIESYAPGLVEKSQNVLINIWTTSVFYFNNGVDYFRKEVFVGQLSPENMQKVIIDALNTTQHKAAEYYHWLYEKVQTTIK